VNQPLASNSDQFHVQQSDLEQLFSQLNAQEVEQFYQLYRTWQQQGHVDQLIQEIETLRWQIAENEVLLRQAEPSTMVQADIALLETRGVVDIDLLDRMVGRGEIWLNRTIEQLQRCEQLDMIGESYEAWCEHALEGAYEWISTMEENAEAGQDTQTSAHDEDRYENYGAGTSLIEDAFLKRLMSEENELSNSEDEVASSQEDQGQLDEQNEETAVIADDEDILGDIEAQAPEDLEIEAQQVADFEQNPPEDTTDSTDNTDIAENQSNDTSDLAVESTPSSADDVLSDTSTLSPGTGDTADVSDTTDTADSTDIQSQQQKTQIKEDTIDDSVAEKADRHWPYILNTEETDSGEDVEQPSSPEQRSAETDATGTQEQQEPQSLVQKLLTRVLRW
jgi:hypothetical protein